MIATRKVGLRDEFEKLLNLTKKYLLKNIQIGAGLKTATFENSVVKAMQLKAKGTSFEGKIQQTGSQTFPDIVATEYYGVEVKQTESNKFKSTGNSIFEGTRISSVEDIYLFMCKTKGGFDIRWDSYEKTLVGIVVTHSPRYIVSLENEKTVFEKIGKTYNEFRVLSERDKMILVKKLHEVEFGGKIKWWQ